MFIKEKFTNEQPSNNIIIREKYSSQSRSTPLRGLRESCETIICPGEDCKWNKACMEKCFEERKDAIQQCCLQKCPENNVICQEACATPMVYAEWEDVYGTDNNASVLSLPRRSAPLGDKRIIGRPYYPFYRYFTWN